MSAPEAELARLQAHNRALEEENSRLEARSAELRAEQARLLALNDGLEAQLKETLLELAELKRQLFGEKSEKLTAEEENQLAEVAADLQEQLQRDPPASDDVLEDEADEEKPKDKPKARRRQPRHPLPDHLERVTVVLEPEGLKPCEHCGQGPGRIGCAAHSRRKFHRAVKDGDRRAIWFIAKFRQLYRLEREAKNLRPEDRHQIRQEQAAPIWATLQERAQALQPQLLPKSSLGKAVSYFLNEYEALTGYLKSGTFQIDNNLIENSIRVPAVGRRRWLFIGHPDAGWRSAVIYSLIVSCRRRGINPQEYLTDVLRRLPSMNTTQTADLLPASWKPAPTPAT